MERTAFEVRVSPASWSRSGADSVAFYVSRECWRGAKTIAEGCLGRGSRASLWRSKPA